jgi:diadenosine tetraphosphatase ApaH/serine/threonine PP2A family protein phosphatase
VRIALLSDVHANLEALRATLRRIAAQGVDGVVCLGDVVGYNADPVACIALLREVGALCVAGNHDRAVAGRITTAGFSAAAARGVLWTRRRLPDGERAFLAGLPLQACVADRLVAVHGALLPGGVGCDMTRLDSDERRRACFEALRAHPSGARICAFGHTHHLGIYELRGEGAMRACAGDRVVLREDAYYLVNPGTVGQPRSADRRASFLVLDTGRGTIAVHRTPYDHGTALAKARRAGLAPAPSGLPAPIRAALERGLRSVGLFAPARRVVRALRTRRDRVAG